MLFRLGDCIVCELFLRCVACVCLAGCLHGVCNFSFRLVVSANILYELASSQDGLGPEVQKRQLNCLSNHVEDNAQLKESEQGPLLD